MKKFEKTIQAWYESGERQFTIGEYLFDHDYQEMPCYHYRMAAEIFLKSLNLLYREKIDMKHPTNLRTHKLAPLRKGIKDSITNSQSNILKKSVRAFRVEYTHYKYVIPKKFCLQQSPSKLFNRRSVELHQEAAESILKVTRDCLNEKLPNTIFLPGDIYY